MPVRKWESEATKIVEQILVQRGGQLITLYTPVETRQAAIFIGDYCKQLLELTLEFSTSNRGYVSLILPRIGKNLHKLEIQFTVSSTDFKVIEKRCDSRFVIILWAFTFAYNGTLYFRRGKHSKCRRKLSEC